MVGSSGTGPAALPKQVIAATATTTVLVPASVTATETVSGELFGGGIVVYTVALSMLVRSIRPTIPAPS